MSTKRNRIYSIVLAGTAAGAIWLFVSTLLLQTVPDGGVELCLIKHITGVPCPSCGSTRSVLSLLHGSISGAWQLNPIGFLIAAVLIVAPVWIGSDLLRRRDTFYRFYQQTEKIIRKPTIALPLILLVLMNWIWNITKDL
jgi:hypothetical protein